MQLMRSLLSKKGKEKKAQLQEVLSLFLPLKIDNSLEFEKVPEILELFGMEKTTKIQTRMTLLEVDGLDWLAILIREQE